MDVGDRPRDFPVYRCHPSLELIEALPGNYAHSFSYFYLIVLVGR